MVLTHQHYCGKSEQKQHKLNLAQRATLKESILVEQQHPGELKTLRDKLKVQEVRLVVPSFFFRVLFFLHIDQLRPRPKKNIAALHNQPTPGTCIWPRSRSRVRAHIPNSTGTRGGSARGSRGSVSSSERAHSLAVQVQPIAIAKSFE